MTIPTPAQRAVLAAMTETVPMTGREIAGDTSAQSRGGTFLALAECVKPGWVTVDTSEHTARWLRTRAGTEALAERVVE